MLPSRKEGTGCHLETPSTRDVLCGSPKIGVEATCRKDRDLRHTEQRREGPPFAEAQVESGPKLRRNTAFPLFFRVECPENGSESWLQLALRSRPSRVVRVFLPGERITSK